ncbi:MAG: hypothetical protein GWO39_04120, partial [Gammaproteobacteria bacterium]|nr:hypothetical protein [Gammaproteobacteria bacterium]NIY31578.1 hypothetical protein [Gammaproteobacteria bacterium]
MIKIPRRARLSILGAAGIVFSTTGGAAEQSGALVVPCEGKGRLVSSPVTVEAMGGSMTLGHGTDDAVQVAVEECGRRVIIDAPQARIELLRSVFDPAQLEGTV